MKKKSEKRRLLQLTKETPAARKKRASGGIRLRAAVFEDKKRRELGRKPRCERPAWTDE